MTKFVNCGRIKNVRKLITKEKEKKEMNCKELVGLRKRAIDERLRDYDKKFGVSEENSVVYDIEREVERIGKDYITTIEFENILKVVKEKIHEDSDYLHKLVEEKVCLESYGNADIDESALSVYLEDKEDCDVDIVEVLEDMEDREYWFNVYVAYKDILYKIDMEKVLDGITSTHVVGYENPGDLEGFTIYDDYSLDNTVDHCEMAGMDYYCSDGDSCRECTKCMHGCNGTYLDKKEMYNVMEAVIYSYMRWVMDYNEDLESMLYAPQYENRSLYKKYVNIKYDSIQ